MKIALFIIATLFVGVTSAADTFGTYNLQNHSRFSCEGKDTSGNSVKLEYFEDGWVNATVNGNLIYGGAGFSLETGWFRNPTPVSASYKNYLVDESTFALERQNDGTMSVNVNLKGGCMLSGPNKNFTGTITRAVCQ